MNETITLPKLITLVGQATECTPAEARKFVHDFFALIEQTLAAGEMVTIKGVGTFARTDNPAAPIKFQADDELAAAVNEPFSAFQAVELNDGVTDDMLQEQPTAAEPTVAQKPSPVSEREAEPEVAAEPEPVSEPKPTPEPSPASEPEPEDTPAEEPAQEGAPASEEEAAQSAQSEPVTKPATEPQTPTQIQQKPQPTFSVPPLAEDEEEVVDEALNDDDNEAQGPSHRSLWFVLGLLLGLIAGLIGGYIAGRNAVDTSSDDIDRIMAEVDSLRQVGVVDTVAAVAEVVDTVAPQPVQNAAPKPEDDTKEVYDTVRSGYYLTTMAGKHYGHKNYWVFIYQANPGLGNPNAIGPGTKVKIPPMESFAEPTEEATKAKAQQILNDLHAKYNI